MTLPTDSQWARYSVLCAQLRPLPPAARQAQLAAWQGAGVADPQVLSLVALHYALPPDADRDRTGERLGAFTLEAPLGAGGMGIVYRAQQHLGQATRAVALKLIHPALLRTVQEEVLARFQAEMGTLGKLEHEGIARIYDGGIGEDPHTHEPLPYIAMELVRGGLPLTTYAGDYGLAWPERLALFVRVCHAVRYAHEHRIIHRDLKPGNILVDSDGRPVVLDFGLAEAYDAVLPGAHLALSGTLAYMSPEQVLDGWGAVSDKSDVYALGLMLYELLTGQHPYASLCDGSVARLRQVIAEVTLPLLRQSHPAYDEELEAVLAAALAKRPAERLSVAVLRSRLERYVQQLPPDSNRPGPHPRQAQRDPTGTAFGELAPEARPPEAERRQLTILFCDLVASIALATQLDPEDLREVIRAYHVTCAAAIQRFDGHIAQYLGAGVLVYYGYPQAHEDDAHRAVRTGLGIVEAMGPLQARLESTYGIRLAIRVGIHTGLVVVGAVGVGDRQAPLALGATPTVATRLQELALPNTVVMSDTTWRLVQGSFVSHDLGSHDLQGMATAVQLHQILSERPARNRFAVAHTTGLPLMVGRGQELGLLQERWRQATDGQGQVVLLSGEAGIGKSRLVQALTEHLPEDGHTRIACYGSPYYQQSAFYPLSEEIQRRWQFGPDDTPQEKLRKLEDALAVGADEGDSEDVLPLFAALLMLPLPEHASPLTLTPPQQKQKTLAAMLAWLLKAAERLPVCFIMEDVHWVDASTLEFLSLLIEQVPTIRMLVLLLCRSGFQSPWAGRSHLTQLTLTRLTPSQVTTMVTQLTGGKALPAEVHQHVIASTDGVPLFVEEVTKMLLESGLLRERAGGYALAGPLPSRAIPATLYDALMARLDRLGPAKQVAQLGAVIGREFPYALIQAVSLAKDATLSPVLGRLVEAELLYQRGLPPHATYLFKHALIQEAAYESLLKSRRVQLHHQVAHVLEERWPATKETQPELLAHHYTEAGLPGQALPYWYQAGQSAHQRSAYIEAIHHLTKALALLEPLPDTPERATHELALYMTLGSSLQATKGYAAPEVARCFARAHELCQHVGVTPQLSPVLGGLWAFYAMGGEFQRARAMGEQLLTVAYSAHEPLLMLEAHLELGFTLFFLGELTAAQEHLAQAIGRYNPAQHSHHTFLYGLDPQVASLAYAASVRWLLGYPEQALQQIAEALTLAQGLAHPSSLAVALHLAARLYLFRREPQDVYASAAALITLAAERGLLLFGAVGTLARGVALAAQGQAMEGIAQIREGLVAYRATGAAAGQTSCLASLAETYGYAQQADEGLHVLAEALAVADTTGECFYTAELYRLQGELLLQKGQGAGARRGETLPSVCTPHSSPEMEAEAWFVRALALARQQHAKSWELRAATSLARLWQAQGKRAEAHALLAPIYGWFTEGFDTADLQDAKTLLEELGG